MKKWIIFAYFFSMSSALLAQNNNTTEELSTLKKQVSSLNNKNSRFEKNLNNVKQSSQRVQDSLIASINEINLRLSALQKSLKARDHTILRTKARTVLIFHSLRTRKIAFYIIAPVIMLVLTLLYWQLSKGMKTELQKNESQVANLAQTLDDEVAKTKKEFQSQLIAQKEAIEKILAEIKGIKNQNMN